MASTTSIPAEWRVARRVLAIRLDNLGDVLVTTPAIHAIRQSLPQIELTLLAGPVGAQAGRLNPDIDNVIVYQAPWMDPWHRLALDPEREQRMIAQLRHQQFDGAIIFTSFRQSPLPAAYLCYLAGVPLRVAASIDGPGSLLTTRHKHPERMLHEVERGLDLVGAIGMTTDDRDLVLHVPDEARLALDREFPGLNCQARLAAKTQHPKPALEPGSARSRGNSERSGIQRPWIVIHPGCSMPARTYPWEMYAEVAGRLIERLGATVVLTGTAEEAQLVAQVRDRLRHDALVLVGRHSFAVFCALIEAADLVITNNTGPMHVAAALKTPVVTLFALTNPPEQWGPWRVPHRQLYHDVACRICYSRVCPYGHECLRLVTPDMVVDSAAELLAETYGSTLKTDPALPVLG